MTQRKPTILLVEDEENLHEALRLNLELEGYEITSAYTGNEALKKIEEEYFDLVIMDIM
ncbi:MAG: response regulator, partial [Flavitalea sp.]